MQLEEFQHVLQIGLGRIILFLQEHDATPYRDLILDACIHNRTFDPQSEGSRARYMYDIIRLTNEEQFYRNAILNALITAPAHTSSDEEGNEYWHISQLFDLARYFVQEQGDEEARQVMYQTFARLPDEMDILGADDLIELDGLDGLLYVVEQYRENAIECIGDYGDWFLSIVEERNGKDAAARFIEREEANYPHFVSFITHVLTKKTELLTRVERRILYEQTSYDQLKQIIATQSSPPIFFVRWGQHASVADVAQAANDFQKLEKSLHIEPYLHIFRKRQFPLAPDKLLELARSVNPSIAQAAVNALELIKHPAIRSLALEFAQARDKSIEAIQLLVNNYQNGDYKLIQTIIASTQDKDELHAIAMNVLDIFNITHTNEATEVLLTLYERNPCSICRRKLVELLISLNTLPNEIAHECQHDAQDSLREIITHYPTRSRE